MYYTGNGRGKSKREQSATIKNMKRYFSFHYFWKLITLVADGALLYGGFVAAYFVRLYADPLTSLHLLAVPPLIFSWEDYLNLILPIIVVWLCIFLFSGLYHLEKTRELGAEIRLLFSALNTGVVVYVIVTFFRGEQLFSRLIIIYAWVLCLLLIGVGRIVLRAVRKYLRRFGFGIKNILVIGTDPTAEQLLEGFRQRDIWNYRIVGVVPTKQLKQKKLCGFPVIGSLQSIEELVKKNDIGEVILTLSSLDQEAVLQIITTCKEHDIRFTFVPDMLQLLSSYNTTAMINGLPLISIRKTPLQGYNLGLKRSFDLAVSLLITILISPILLIITTLVKLTSPGPIFIRQERIGLDGMVFQTYKFRSMTKDAHGKGGRFWTVKDDPRITPVGKYLRKFNLDELPQLFNVLSGEMSLVGPRPEQPRFVEEFKKQIPRYMDRHGVKAGMTGWAQVNGWRGDTSIEERVRYDIYYLENWSIWFDIRILFKTLWSMGS